MGLEQVILRPESGLVGQSAQSLNLRRRYGINLLAISRQGGRLSARLSATKLLAGDVLLLHGDKQVLMDLIARFRLVPLVSAEMRLIKPTRILSALLIFAAGVVVVVMGWAPVDVSFVAAAVLMVLFGYLSLRELYDSLELPILVLLGAFISIGAAFERTGDAAWIAHLVLDLGHNWPVAAIVGLLMVITLGFSNFINNAATAVIFAPIAVSVAHGLGISPDPLLMAVALGSCLPFLTPVGHQCNALVLNPGGYRFGDYWKLGLPLSLFLVLVAVPMILWVWPARL
ncbi:TrkA domain-containing protein [mine drainage metagenome]